MGDVPAVLWLLAGLVLCAGELLTLDLVLLVLGTSAIVTAGAALAVDGLAAQLVVFVGTALVLLLGVRPAVRRHLAVPALPGGHERLPGRVAVVVQHVGEDGGQVRVDGELWRARPYAGGADLPVGTDVVVALVEGATLHVYAHELP